MRDEKVGCVRFINSPYSICGERWGLLYFFLMARVSRKNNQEIKEVERCPICMERAVNVRSLLFSVKQSSALMNFATGVSPSGEGYMSFYTEKRELPALQAKNFQNPL